MTLENDRFLQLMSEGNTLEALDYLATVKDGRDSSRLALNRAMYGPPSDANLMLVREEETRQMEMLDELEGREKAEVLYNLGCFALVQDDILAARIQFTEAVKLRPDDLMSRHNLAYARELLAETEEAHTEYEHILSQNSAIVLSQINLSLLKLQQGDTEVGLEDLKRIHGEAPENMGVLLYLCRGLLMRASNEDIEEVLSLLKKAAVAENFVDLREIRAYALYLHGDAEAARTAFGELLESNENNQFALMGMIKLTAENSEFEELTGFAERYRTLDQEDLMSELLTELKSGA